MKPYYSIFLLFLNIYAIELLQKFRDQVAGKSLFFSLRIDDKFNDIILNATVKRPDFLYISKQGIELKKIAQINLFESAEIKSSVLYGEKVYVFKGREIDIYDISNCSYPTLEQRYFDEELEYYDKIEVDEEIILVIKELEVLVFILKEKIFPEKVGNISLEETILFSKVIKGRIILGFNSGIKVYQLKDIEIRYFDLEESINFNQIINKNLYIKDYYFSQDYLYLLENQLGILEFTFFPIKLQKKLPFFGSKLTGYGQELCIDGRIVVNTMTSVVKYYSTSLNCFYLRIDSEFIYCGYSNVIFIVSRLVSVQQQSIMDFLYGIHTLKKMLLLVNHKNIQIVEPQLGALYIEGKTPGSVGVHKVVFEIESISGNLTENFLLTVQYNLSDVIIIILLSFISIFFMVFICSCIIKFINKTPQEPIETGRVSTDPHAISSERNIVSDRHLIRK